MICPECNGRGETIRFVEIERDENTVTVAKRKVICGTCNGSGVKPMTNGDRIRLMTDEQLAAHLVVYHDDCGKYTAPGGMYDSQEEALAKALEWLRSEVGGDG